MLTFLIICVICGVYLASHNSRKSAIFEAMKLFFGTIGCLGTAILLLILLFIGILI